MKKLLLAGVAVLAITGSTAVYAQHRGFGFGHSRLAPEDRAAFLDARIAAVHARLRLTPYQDKLWPPLETAVRDLVKQRIDRANARMQTREEMRRQLENGDGARDSDPVAGLRQRAETMGETAAALKKVADAADPLYKTLDDGQKRRLAMLTHMERRFDRGPGFGREGGRFEGRERFEHRQGRGGPDGDFRRGHDEDDGPARL